NNVSLSVHGPYFVNLASDDNRKFYGSIKYITDSILIGGIAGAESVTFHSGFYQDLSAKETYERVHKAFSKIYAEFEKKKFDGHPIREQKIAVAPELTGKPTQFGDLEELISMANDYQEQNLRFCFDFAHKFARSNGKYNTYDEFMQMLDQIADDAGEKYLENLHIHISGIMYSEKGEKNHVTFLESLEMYKEMGIEIPEIEKEYQALVSKNKNGGSDFNWRDLLKALKTRNVGGWVVCESPILELDALLMQTVYNSF
ncbi:TIM barrel protein, partial [Candidatus Dojkabacteria bacterium]|nr:TIM barrel protein [Candidatus Dojkabacteria bacterium]